MAMKSLYISAGFNRKAYCGWLPRNLFNPSHVPSLEGRDLGLGRVKLFGFLAGLLLGATALIGTSRIADSATLDGFIIGAPAESLKVYRNTSGGLIDTIRTATDEWCYWNRLTQDFDPDASVGDIIFLKDKDNTISQRWVIKSTGNHFLDMYQNKHTVNAENVIDTCHVLGELKMEYYLPTFTQPETTAIDTGANGLDYYYDIHAPFNKSDAVVGRNGKLKLFKIKGDTTFCKVIDFVINKDNGDVQLLNGPIYFPDSSYIGNPNAVEMSYFGAMPYGNGIKLNWETQSSLDSYLWEILRGEKNDSLDYDLIATQPGDGNSNQSKHWYYDDACAKGTNSGC